ncbi:MAG: VWA domain-containing protein [Candidatus Marsarchaeota archaeon]|nr:VWA domain-containing protein [Candidatus Marsarchaeota archaeon]
MPYTAEISRSNPSCFLFLIDQSGSMQDVMDLPHPQPMTPPPTMDGRTYSHPAQGKNKAQALADAINRLLQNLVIRCAKAEGVRDYYDIGVIGYGAQVGPALGGPLAGKNMVPISEVADNPARIEERIKKVDDGAGGLVDQKIRFPIWFEPVANGATPMCEAFGSAISVVQGWLGQHPNCFPPIVINITDGEATDTGGDPNRLIALADSLKQIASSDGNVLLFNVHISSQKATPVEFPDTETGLPDEYARLLFRMSSVLPEYMQNAARQEEITVSQASRGFAFNADIVAVIRFLDIGTRPSNLR